LKNFTVQEFMHSSMQVASFSFLIKQLHTISYRKWKSCIV